MVKDPVHQLLRINSLSHVCPSSALFDASASIFILLNYISCEGEVLVEKPGFEAAAVPRIDFAARNTGMETSMWSWPPSSHLAVVVDVASAAG
uniref:Uncharacterized protein n=1 Tax=Physcomitrium patens TaxID=3218 RepID=A0A2K1KCQ2_PHYPA|nr:hypothetical protein PHYPA_010747 [Physcomitrium patens]